ARLIATSSAPRNLAPEMPFSFAGDLHALLARFLAKPIDASRAGACARFRSGDLGQLDIGKDADDQDLITIGSDLGWTCEPGVGQSSGKPGANFFSHGLHHYARAAEAQGLALSW